MPFQLNPLDGLCDLRFFLLRRGDIATDKLIVGGARHFESSAKHRDRPLIAMLVNEREPQLFSLAKNAVTFLKCRVPY
ncbi:hypothetical protein Rcae01_03493 [Novipirellula caenicola]|uniref:Uncharacterized protein n=1 Tax=Novipirellula caenicola TaxID=1536901 RepID=A0ABP9VS89_9BACT